MGEGLITRRNSSGVLIEFKNYYNSVEGLTYSTPTALSVARNNLAGASVGDYALFAGGYNGSSVLNVVDAYNTSLTRSTPTSLSAARSSLAGASVGAYALFAGGDGGGAVVDAYNTSLTRSTPTALSVARNNLAGASVGDYALFAGGNSDGGRSNVVNAYSFIAKAYIPVTQGSKYKFTEGSEQTASTNTTLVYNQKVTGYVKYKKGKITM